MKKNYVYILLILSFFSTAKAYDLINPCKGLDCQYGCYIDENNIPKCCENETKNNCLIDENVFDLNGCLAFQKKTCYAHECCMPDGTCQAKKMIQVTRKNEKGECVPEIIWYCPNEKPSDEC